jgi:hypothetical protein
MRHLLSPRLQVTHGEFDKHSLGDLEHCFRREGVPNGRC